MAKKRSTPATKGISASSRQPVVSDAARRAAVFAFAFSGMAALIYEVLWTRELELVFGSTVYAVSMMLAAFMSGLSLGAWLGGKWADRSSDLLGLFARLELGIAVFGLLSLPLVQVLPSVYFVVYDSLRPTFGVFFIIQLLMSFLIMLVPTTFMGATFPVVSKINTPTLDELGEDVGNVYSINTLGSIVGSLAAGFLLIPLIGVKATTFVAASLNVFVAFAVFWMSRREISRAMTAMLAVGLAVAVGLGLVSQQPAFAHSFYRIGDYSSLEEYQAYRDSIVARFDEDDVHGRVVVFEAGDGERYLQNSGKVEGSSGQLDLQTTSLLSLVPIHSAQDPSTALVIGLGTGYTTRAALSTDLERVDTIEINEAVVEASRLFVGDEVESDPRSEIFIRDARNYLNTTDRTYDVVTSEPSYPLSTHVSHLFTLEFYELVNSRLSDDGVFCQWIPRYLLEDDDTLMMLNTFAEVFPQTYLWGSNQGGNEAVDMLLIGVKGQHTIDPEAVAAAVRADAPVELDFDFYGGPAEIAQATADPSLPFNVDDRPLLEFKAPRNQIEFYREGLEGLEAR